MHIRSAGHVALAVTLVATVASAQSSSPFLGAEQGQLIGSSLGVSDQYGAAIDLDGSTAVLGDRWTTVATLGQAGSAHVFVESGGIWAAEAALFAPDPTTSAAFGCAVALDGDTLAVGAERASSPGGAATGAVYVFTRNAGAWTLQQKVVGADSLTSDVFGRSVSVDGDTLAIGAAAADLPGKINAGAVYVFTRSGAVWSQQQKLIAASPSAAEQFGEEVELDGDSLAIGAPFAGTGGLASNGAAYVFTRVSSAWSMQQKLTASDAASFDGFGRSIALRGDRLLVGAPRDDNAGGVDAGASYAFSRSGSTWTEQQKLASPAPGANQSFGNDLGMSGAVALIGQGSREFPDATDTGDAFVFVNSGAAWFLETELFANDAAPGDEFGATVALDGARALVGAPYKPAHGVVYAFALTSSPVVYCTSQVNSQGCTPSIGFAGVPSASGVGAFTISAADVLNQRSGVLFYGFDHVNAPFLGGTLCVTPPTHRTPVQSSGGNLGADDCSGSFQFAFNAYAQSGVDPLLVAGVEAFAQYWSRDPASPSSTNLTNALHFALQP